MSTYSRTEMISAFIDSEKTEAPHPDFQSFWKRKLAALEQAARIQMSVHGIPMKLAPMFALFRSIARSYIAITSSSVLEGGLIVRTVRQVDSPDLRIESRMAAIAAQKMACANEHLELLDRLFCSLWGELNLSISSDDLRSLGFDDSSEPQIEDYYEHI